MMRHSIDGVALAGILTLTASTAAAQPPPAAPNWKVEFLGPEIPLGPTVSGAPYCADAMTTVTQTLADGTQINRTTTAKLCRDSEGRVRREQTILGLAALDPSADSVTVVTILDPVAQVTYVLDPRTHQARRLPVTKAQILERRIPPPPPPAPQPGDPPLRRALETANVTQSLGTKQLEGLEVVGTRRVETIPSGRIGNDRPIEITDERWEAPALKILVLSQHHDPRSGDIEYRLTNITRTDPPRDLFAVPADYAIVDKPGERH